MPIEFSPTGNPNVDRPLKEYIKALPAEQRRRSAPSTGASSEQSPSPSAPGSDTIDVLRSEALSTFYDDL